MITDSHDYVSLAATPTHPIGAANASLATPTPASPLDGANVTDEAGDANSGTSIVASDNHLTYTLTVGQAQELIMRARRRVPSVRTLQRYCQQGKIIGKKISTTFTTDNGIINGSEWLINDLSLQLYIDSEPTISGGAGDANSGVTPPLATPTHPIGDANPLLATPGATPPLNGANVTDEFGVAGDAELDKENRGPIGERRTLAELLIENAKLGAMYQGLEKTITSKNETIAELKDDRGFLREEIREARTLRQDVKELAMKMLQTMNDTTIAKILGPGVQFTPPSHVESTVVQPSDNGSSSVA